MSGRRTSASDRRSAHSKRTPPKPESPNASCRHRSPLPANAESVLDECIAAISLVDVTVHSLELREIASPEQEVLKRALEVFWFVHDWIDNQNRIAAGRRSDREIEP